MEIVFTPSPDVRVVLNALLDIFERRHARNPTLGRIEDPDGLLQSASSPTRAIKVTLTKLSLPAYFSQTDPTPRLVANEQFIYLEKIGSLKLIWLPNETNHILQAITLIEHEACNTLYTLLKRIPLSSSRSRLEQILLADKFRFQGDWRARAVSYILSQFKAEKSPGPFSLTDSNLNIDLLAVLQALPALTAETPYRVFSVRVFNDTKRFESIKSHIVRLARLGNPEWKHIPAEEVLRELNLVANPNYIHLSGNWQITTGNGEVLDLSGFTPSVGFPAAQISTLQSVRAVSVLCIENLTTFHQYTQMENAIRTMRQTIICTYGNPSPAIRRILCLLPKATSIYLWSDLDYGGFNILRQLRQTVGNEIQPYLMDIDTLEANIPRARPLTVSDKTNLKRLSIRPELRDIRPVIEHMLKRGLKLEQEGVEEFRLLSSNHEAS
jgi:hypothetical protein